MPTISAASTPVASAPQRYWSRTSADLLQQLSSSREGLAADEAKARLERYGPNALDAERLSWLLVFFEQVRSPLVLLLVFAALASGLTGAWLDAGIVLSIVDVVLLSAGSLVPADAVLLDAIDLHVSEAALTGESFPVLKGTDPSAADASLVARKNCVFLGTNVRSWTS